MSKRERLYGSVINRVTGSSTAVGVGSPATLLMWSDRVPMVVTAVVPFKTGARAGEPRIVRARRVEAYADPVALAEGRCGLGHQHWVVRVDHPYGAEVEFRSDRSGNLMGGGGRLAIGRAERYFDWTF